MEAIMSEIEEKIRKFLIENFVLSEQLDELGFEESFLENGVVDSTGILELVFFVEDQFGIQIDTSEVLPENFDSVNCLASFIRRKQKLAL
ncbi:MAG: acyl carrier protein [Anaerolineae bacterium]|nr:acyl carrier protein [Anaerolineae bacterium]